MTTENLPNKGAIPEQPRRAAAFRPVSVSNCGLALKDVRLVSLVCSAVATQEGEPLVADLLCRGALVKGSVTATGFHASVSWALSFPDGSKQPISISGKHELIFSVKKAITPDDARYYSEVNSVILAYPYLRQLIDDLSTKSLGRNVMIPPLDVPRFVTERSKAMLEAYESRNGAENGAKADEVAG